MKESDIRPKDAAEKAAQLRLQDIESIFYKNGKIDPSMLIKVPCPACGTNNTPISFEKGGFHFKTCASCHTLYISPRPNQQKLLQYYQQSKSIDYFTREILEKTKDIRIEKIFKPRAERVNTLLNQVDIQKNVLVDIGGGNGLFLDVMRSLHAGFKRYINIEPSLEGAKLTKEKGLEIVNDFVENVEFTFEVSAVTGFELIEHLFAPLDFIKKINALLGKNGIFIFTLPNIEGFDLTVLEKNSDNIWGPNHLNYFNPKSVGLLCKQGGFDIVHLETPGLLDVDIVKNKIQAGVNIDDTFVTSLMKKDEKTLNNFQKFLQENSLSSNMLVVARKTISIQ